MQVAAGPEAMTVTEADALLYLPGHPRQQLLRALRIPALPAGWRASFQAMLDQPGAGNAGVDERISARARRRLVLVGLTMGGLLHKSENPL